MSCRDHDDLNCREPCLEPPDRLCQSTVPCRNRRPSVSADQGGLFDVADFDATTWKHLVETGYEQGLASGYHHDRRNRRTNGSIPLSNVRRAARETRLRQRIAEERRQTVMSLSRFHLGLQKDDSILL